MDASRVLHSGTGASQSFVEWVMKKGLINMGYTGQKFTWSHGVNVETRRAARLDRGLCNDEWTRSFPMENIKNLLHPYLDHCPFLI